MKNKKGFTLIELLAVIVILGLLMAIAIPSVTKYITQSRKKTLVTTMDNYIKGAMTEVNDMEYTFTSPNTIYGIPIECISLESGGLDPFGEWYQANKSYWAYVLVQYDDESSSYIYGFTFKDSAGYEMEPYVQTKLNQKLIKTGNKLKQPINGLAQSYTSSWDSFNVDSTTKLKLLKATKENELGDGVDTCTLKQKGKNYNEKEINSTPNVEKSTILYWSYDDTSKTLIISSNDISKNTSIGGSFTSFSFNNNQPWVTYRSKIVTVKTEGVVAPNSLDGWFQEFTNASSFDLSNLYTNNVTSMYNTFNNAGYYPKSWSIGDISNWDTSKVTNMSYMFYGAGYNSSTWYVGDLGKWDVSKVTNMQSMFFYTGVYSKSWSVGDLSKWNTSNVTNMSLLFYFSGRDSTSWNVGDLSNWKTSKVTDMSYMFSYAGRNSSSWSTGDLSNWDTSNVTTMFRMFDNTSINYNWSQNLSKWNVSKVTNHKEFQSQSKITEPKWVS